MLSIRFLPMCGAFALAALAGADTALAQTIERVKLTDNDLSCQQIYAESQQMDTAMQLAGPGLPASLTAPPPAAAPVPQGAPLSAVQQAVLNHPNNANLTPEQKATLIAQTGLAESRGNAAVAGLYAGAPSAAALHGAVAMDPGVQAAVARARASGMSEAQINATMGLGMQRAGLGAAAAPSAGQAYAQAGGLAGMLGAGMSAQGGNGSNAQGLAGIFGALAGAAAPRAAPAAAPAAVPAAAAAPPQGAGLGAQAKARKDHLTGLFLSRGCRMSDVQK
ncbi:MULTISPECIES: hypothetical protein [unclassified Polaromonas]|uniref:hypothetical protein n=1 Tax=unclassified Polaromonas TaxID=2638319 RepID=UPI000F08683F|nr:MULTISPECIES: hypothetical protein [unclassified Polaromonas]AYQ27699.1 hypothetical protein DT070_06460 [Polaromonas sp. SP1]QGJ17451.1 hypothetical protein F7R28_02965 [Polaromonas sp. Pch-P]